MSLNLRNACATASLLAAGCVYVSSPNLVSTRNPLCWPFFPIRGRSVRGSKNLPEGPRGYLSLAAGDRVDRSAAVFVAVLRRRLPASFSNVGKNNGKRKLSETNEILGL